MYVHWILRLVDVHAVAKCTCSSQGKVIDMYLLHLCCMNDTNYIVK